MNLAIGIDAGGTKLAVGLVDVSAGILLDHRIVAAKPARGAEAVLDDCVELARQVAGTQPIEAVGVGVPELVSLDGRITTAVNWDWSSSGWQLPLSSIAPVHVESDVRAAALAEARFGAGKGLSSFLYLTVGTGISHTFVLGGSPWRGAHGNAVVTGAPAVEKEASGAAIANRAGKNRAEDVFSDYRYQPIIKEAAQSLGIELARLVNALDPEAVVIGGGLGLRADYREAIDTAMRTMIYAETSRSISVVPCLLGYEVGMIGAAVAPYHLTDLSAQPMTPFTQRGG